VNGAIDESQKLPLIINMDECSIAYYMTAKPRVTEKHVARGFQDLKFCCEFFRSFVF